MTNSDIKQTFKITKKLYKFLLVNRFIDAK